MGNHRHFVSRIDQRHRHRHSARFADRVFAGAPRVSRPAAFDFAVQYAVVPAGGGDRAERVPAAVAPRAAGGLAAAVHSVGHDAGADHPVVSDPGFDEPRGLPGGRPARLGNRPDARNFPASHLHYGGRGSAIRAAGGGSGRLRAHHRRSGRVDDGRRQHPSLYPQHPHRHRPGNQQGQFFPGHRARNRAAGHGLHPQHILAVLSGTRETSL